MGFECVAGCWSLGEIPGSAFCALSCSFASSGFYSVDFIVRWVTEAGERRTGPCGVYLGFMSRNSLISLQLDLGFVLLFLFFKKVQ